MVAVRELAAVYKVSKLGMDARGLRERTIKVEVQVEPRLADRGAKDSKGIAVRVTPEAHKGDYGNIELSQIEHDRRQELAS